MEGFFCISSYFFTKRHRSSDRQHQNAPKQGEEIRQKIAQLESPAAEQEKIYDRAAEHGEDHINTHLSIARRHGLDKDSHRDREPKEQIQKPPQKA